MVTDGTSNTAMFGEALTGSGSTTGDRTSVYVSPDPSPRPGPAPAYGVVIAGILDGLASRCEGSTRLAAFRSKGDSWASQRVGVGGGYTHIQVPNRRACVFADGDADPPTSSVDGPLGLSSNHPGGVNLGMMDGAVRFLKNTVSPGAWWQIATSAGAEICSACSY